MTRAKNAVFFLVGVLGVLGLSVLFAASTCFADTDPEAGFNKGVQLMGEKRYQEAMEQFESALGHNPDNPSVLWNLGVVAAEVGRHDKALEYWTRYRLVSPDDWQGIASLVQTRQALGDLASRDRARDEIFRLRASGKNSDLNQAEFYIREQTVIGGRKVIVLEFFEPLKKDWAVFYAFLAVDNAGKPEYRISLGSYETTNQIDRELGNLKEGERLYHLDGYFGKKHVTYRFYQAGKPPAYDAIRVHAVSIIADIEKKGSSPSISALE